MLEKEEDEANVGEHFEDRLCALDRIRISHELEVLERARAKHSRDDIQRDRADREPERPVASAARTVARSGRAAAEA